MRDKLIELIRAGQEKFFLLEFEAKALADHLIANGVGFIPYAPVVKIYKTWLERYDGALALRVDFKIDNEIYHARLGIANEDLSKFGYVQMPADVPDNNVGKWIPVGERLPTEEFEKLHKETGRKVYPCFVYRRSFHFRKTYFMTYANFDGVRFTDPDTGSVIGSLVTHWMPLPEPPKVGEA